MLEGALIPAKVNIKHTAASKRIFTQIRGQRPKYLPRYRMVYPKKGELIRVAEYRIVPKDLPSSPGFLFLVR